MQRNLNVYEGQICYELTVINSTVIYKNKKSYILCKCSCGNIKEIRKDNLFDKRENKRTKSCGCKQSQNRKTKIRRPESMYSTLYTSCKSSAINRKIEFGLLKEQHTEIIQKECHYCGSPPKLGQRVGKYKSVVGTPVIYNGVDRINSNIGYIISNCVPCCSICNKMKMQYSVEDFMKKTLEIYSHQKKLNG